MLRFGKRNAVELVAVAPADKPSTVEIIKTVGVAVTEYCEDEKLRHDFRLATVIGQDRDNPIGYFGSWTKDLRDAGFVWFVKSDFVSKFKYAAQVGGGGSVCENLDLSYTTTVHYIGDMPDYAIERHRVAKATKMFSCFTVHSNEPLKVFRGVMLDPVLVGWDITPAIVVNPRGEFVRCSNRCVGVVIAVWDKEKELEVL